MLIEKRNGLIALCCLALSGCLTSGGDAAAPAAGGGGGGGGVPPVTNNPPVISGNPASAGTVGQSYSFTPQATDPNGDSLTFSIENAPNWSAFNAQTGSLSGTPGAGDVGQYSNIRISVSDGTLTATMSGFSIDVMQVGTSSTTLSWSVPTQNEDGTALTNLQGYKIYYGRSSGNYTNQIDIDNPGLTTFVVENLSPDTYYFSATAINSGGEESRFSGEAQRIVN